MAYEFLVGAVVASVLGFLLIGLRSRRRRCPLGAGKGISGPLYAEKGKADIIVVGAGVAGSALAYALGKV